MSRRLFYLVFRHGSLNDSLDEYVGPFDSATAAVLFKKEYEITKSELTGTYDPNCNVYSPEKYLKERS